MLRRAGGACETAVVSAVLDVSKPTPLRLFGFLFTAAGGLLIALASIQTWATVGIVDDRQGVLDTVIPGVDRVDGMATLVMGVVMLIALVALRIVGSTAARRALALLILACAAASLVIGILDASDVSGRFQDAGAEKIIETVSQARDVPIEEVRRQYEAIGSGIIDFTPGIGLWLVIGGGAVGLVGGLLDLAWVGQQRLRKAGSEVQEPDTGADRRS